VLPRGFARRAGAASGIIPSGTTAGARGAAAALDEHANALFQQAWPEAELGGHSPGKSRRGAPEGERAPKADKLRRLRTLVRVGALPRPRRWFAQTA